MSRKTLTRRQFVAATAMSSAALITAPYVRGAYAAGKLSIGFWDHWVPGANDASTALVKEWGEKEKVEVSIDYITSNNKKIELTAAAEAQAKSGHDILQMPSWWPHAYSENLEPLNDVMEPLIKQNGEVNGTVKYLGQSGGKWLAVPATPGSQIKGPCSRIDLMKKHAGIDVQEMYPAGSPPKADNWTMETFLKAAEACHKAGFPFGIGLGETTDSVDTAGAIFQSFGAELVNAKGDITVKTDAVRQALEFYKKLIAVLPTDAPSWDDASNNKWLISGRGAMILNPPSAWAVAKRDAPQVAEQCWTHGFPSGPKGRFAPLPALLLGRLGLWQEQGSGQELARSPVLASGDREVRRGKRRVRSPRLREHDEVQDLGRGRAAEGHAVPLSGSLQAADDVDRRVSSAAEDRPADLLPGNADQNGAALCARREVGNGARLGGG
ncbi:ABC-type glycerol-3-phosphate transport system substrate-binding protein [Bradyrhizobium sp. LB7.2]